MSKALVAYFSASGVTRKVAQTLAESVGADLFEIEPEVLYTRADLDWRDQNSRSSLEMKDKSSRPAIKGSCDVSAYDTVFIGFPIWWYIAPTIVNTFLESVDLKGKKVVPFATSGSSGMGETNVYLAPSCPGANLVEGKLLNHMSADEIKRWAMNV
ncbi:MAG: flavodoxin [Ruminococcaceae bacterium]|jgi:flavodoxin|nr:flavodoxin [Oscillospiraceae bacterium]